MERWWAKWHTILRHEIMVSTRGYRRYLAFWSSVPAMKRPYGNMGRWWVTWQTIQRHEIIASTMGYRRYLAFWSSVPAMKRPYGNMGRWWATWHTIQRYEIIGSTRVYRRYWDQWYKFWSCAVGSCSHFWLETCFMHIFVFRKTWRGGEAHALQ